MYEYIIDPEEAKAFYNKIKGYYDAIYANWIMDILINPLIVMVLYGLAAVIILEILHRTSSGIDY